MEDIKKLTDVAQVACLAALIAASSVFVLPIGPVPMTLQTMAVAIAGMLLGVVKVLAHLFFSFRFFLGALCSG